MFCDACFQCQSLEAEIGSARTVSVSMGVARGQAHRCTLKERQTVAKSLRLSAGDRGGCFKKQKQVGNGFIP